MKCFNFQRVTGMFILMSLNLLLASAAALLAAEAKHPKLMDSPVPFYHDRNLALLYPAGKSVSVPPDGNQERLTLDECIEIALEDNQDYKISQAIVRLSTGDIANAWGFSFTPLLSASYSMSQSRSNIPITDMDGNLLDRRTNLSNVTPASLNFSYTVFDSTLKYFSIKNVYYLRGARRSQMRSKKLDVVNEVRAAYFNVLRQEKLLIAARDQADQLEKQLHRAEVRFKVGEVTKLDVLQAQIDLQNQELLILEYENLLATARLDLDLVVGGSIGVDYTLADEFEITEPNLDISELIAEAVENHPDLENIEMIMNQIKCNLWIGRLAYLPVIKAVMGLTRSESGLVLTPNHTQGRSLSYSISWNILGALSRFQANRYNQVTVDTLKYSLAKARLTTTRNIRASYLEMLRLHQQHFTLNESKTMAAQSLQLETRRYELGTSSMVELRQAQADYSQAEVDYINSIYDYHAALSELSRSVGRDLSLE
jgi:outer membrane protein